VSSSGLILTGATSLEHSWDFGEAWTLNEPLGNENIYDHVKGGNRWPLQLNYRGEVLYSVKGLDTYKRIQLHIDQHPWDMESDTFAYEQDRLLFHRDGLLISGTHGTDRVFILPDRDRWDLEASVALGQFLGDEGITVHGLELSTDLNETIDLAELIPPSGNWMADQYLVGALDWKGQTAFDNRERYRVVAQHLPFGTTNVAFANEGMRVSAEPMQLRMDTPFEYQIQVPLSQQGSWQLEKIDPPFLITGSNTANTGNELIFNYFYAGDIIAETKGLNTMNRFILRSFDQPFGESRDIIVYEGQSIHLNRNEILLSEAIKGLAAPQRFPNPYYQNWEPYLWHTTLETRLSQSPRYEGAQLSFVAPRHLANSAGMIQAHLMYRGAVEAHVFKGLDTRDRYMLNIQHMNQHAIAKTDHATAREGDWIQISPEHIQVADQITTLSTDSGRSILSYRWPGGESQGERASFFLTDTMADPTNAIEIQQYHEYDERLMVNMKGFDSRKRYVYDLSGNVQNPDRLLSAVELQYDPRVESSETGYHLLNFITRSSIDALLTTSDLPEQFSVGDHFRNGQDIVVYVGNLKEEGYGPQKFWDDGPSSPSMATYRIYSWLRSEDGESHLFSEDHLQLDMLDNLENPSLAQSLAQITTGNTLLETEGLSDPFYLGLDQTRPPKAIVMCSPGEARTKITWSFPREGDLNQELEVRGLAIYHREKGESTWVLHEGAESLLGRYWEEVPLKNGVTHEIQIVTWDRVRHLAFSDIVDVRPQRGNYARYDVANFRGFRHAKGLDLSWNFHQDVIEADDAIGYLLYRNGELIEGLPRHPLKHHSSNYRDKESMDPLVEVQYQIKVIDRNNRLSAGQPLIVSPDHLKRVTGIVHTIQDGTWPPKVDLSGQAWQLYGREENMGLVDGKYWMNCDEGQPAMLERTIPETVEISLKMVAQVSGNTLDGVTIAEAKLSDSWSFDAGPQEAAHSWATITVYQEELVIVLLQLSGLRTFIMPFYHGGKSHEYRLGIRGGDIELQVDGVDLTRHLRSQEAKIDEVHFEPGQASLRLGARSSGNVEVMLSDIEYAVGSDRWLTLENPEDLHAQYPANVDSVQTTFGEAGNVIFQWDNVDGAVAYHFDSRWGNNDQIIDAGEGEHLRLELHYPEASKFSFTLTAISKFGQESSPYHGEIITPVQPIDPTMVLHHYKAQNFVKGLALRDHVLWVTDGIALEQGAQPWMIDLLNREEKWCAEFDLALLPDISGPVVAMGNHQILKLKFNSGHAILQIDDQGFSVLADGREHELSSLRIGNQRGLLRISNSPQGLKLFWNDLWLDSWVHGLGSVVGYEIGEQQEGSGLLIHDWRHAERALRMEDWPTEMARPKRSLYQPWISELPTVNLDQNWQVKLPSLLSVEYPLIQCAYQPMGQTSPWIEDKTLFTLPTRYFDLHKGTWVNLEDFGFPFRTSYGMLSLQPLNALGEPVATRNLVLDSIQASTLDPPDLTLVSDLNLGSSNLSMVDVGHYQLEQGSIL
jgi:hypothetical protein